MIATIAFGLLIVSLIIQIIVLFKKDAKPDSIAPWI